MSYFGDKIRQLRREKNLSQGDVAQKIGVSRNTFSEWESGDIPQFIAYIYELAKFFNVPPWVFFEPDTEEQAWKAKMYERLRIYEQKQAQASRLFSLLADTFSNDVHKSVD